MILDLSQSSWCAQASALNLPPSHSTEQWLTKPFVLGSALEKAHGAIEVEVLSQDFGLAFENEIASLQGNKNSENNENNKFFIREVYLKSINKILVYGRVTIPEVTFLNNKQAILELKNKSFGKHILYCHPNYRRSDFEYACVKHNLNPTWGRRSVFWLNDDPLMVTEFYMTDLGEFPI